MVIPIAESFSKGKIATYHDFEDERVREGLDSFIDTDETHENVVLQYPKYMPEEVARDRTKAEKPLADYIEDYVNEQMAPFIKAKNDKQKRKDRKLLDQFGNDMKYMDYAKNCKVLKDQALLNEYSTQIGSHDELGGLYHQAIVNGDDAEKERIKGLFVKYYKKYLEEFKTLNPHLDVVAAVIHFDEHENGTPHMQFQVMPIADYTGCKNNTGMKVDHAVVFTKALENDDYGNRNERSIDAFYNFQHDILREDYVLQLAKEIDPDNEYVLKEQKHGKKHEETADYRKKKLRNEKLAEDTKALEDANKKAKDELTATTNSITTRRKMLADAEEKLEEFEDKKAEMVKAAELEVREAVLETAEELEAEGVFDEQVLKLPEVQEYLEEKSKELMRQKAFNKDEEIAKKVMTPYLEPLTPVKRSDEDMPS